MNLEKLKELAFESLKNKHNPFPEIGIVGEVHCLDDEELEVFAKLLLKEFISHLNERAENFNTELRFVFKDELGYMEANLEEIFNLDKNKNKQ